MQEPLRLAFRNMEPPIGVEDAIRRHVDALEQFWDRITACSVVVEARHRHHHQGKLYHVRIELMVPGRQIVVHRDPAEAHAHEDLHVAIRDAFKAARRQLQDHVRILDGDIKLHDLPLIGEVVRLMPDYGFLRTPSGDEVYVHRNAVLGDGFDGLKLGDRVRYVVQEGEGEHGPQASTAIPL